MFYVKINDGEKVIKEELTDENIFTICPRCGREIHIDLAETFPNGEIDLFGTSVMCSECSKMLKEISNKAFNIAKETRDMVLTGEDLDVVETILSEDIEKLVMNYWNEVLHRESMIEEEM